MATTPDVTRRVGLGLTPSPAPFLTPRPERRRMDSFSSRQDKEVNVQVLLRCRPLSDDEQRLNVARVLSCNEQKKEVTVMQSIANKQVDRVFTFDKVFGPKAQQRSIYDQAIAPIVNEVLDGFSCTVFAYGQTGTGKTYTMEGGMRNKGGDLPAEAGVITRAVRHIFETLEAQNADYSMKVTFLELYNEEITDLLSSEDNTRNHEDRQKKPISLMEDGKGCVVVRGLEEEAVYSATDIYSLLERGAAKRRTADTLLNKRSSRSHSVFSITVHIKEEAVGDEELIKCGKLNLVDLAGSENISRSGAREGRAREAGEINKSLLTLGRVINALVEHSPHVPYRDSKLTRILRDSLGGKTKTCVIATISPSAHCLDETLSTLDYAHRAKNIKNKPEANQKISKTVLLKDLYLEIERMREDVRAARDKNGVYVPHERFAQDEAEKKARIHRIEQLENHLNRCERQVDKFRRLYHSEQEEKLDLENELKNCKINLEDRNNALLDLQLNHKRFISLLKEKEFIISKMKLSENALVHRAKELRNDLHDASEDITSLFARLDQKEKTEAENHNMLLKFGSQLDQNLKGLHKEVLGSISQQQQQLRSMEEHAQSFLASKHDITQVLDSKIKKMKDTYGSGVRALKNIAETLQKKASNDMEQIDAKISSQIEAVEQLLGASAAEATKVTEDIRNSLDEQKELLAFASRQQHEGLQQSLACARHISNAATDILSDIYEQAHKLMAALEAIQTEKSRQLAAFEDKFKEEARREEKKALQEIAMILANLTVKKTSVVSEASQRMQHYDLEESKRLQQELSTMQQISNNARKQLHDYAKDTESHFIKNTIAAAESRAMIEDCLQETSKWTEQSRQLWEKTRSHTGHLNLSSRRDLRATMNERIDTNQNLHEEISSALTSMNEDLDSRTENLLATLNDSLTQDQENKEAIDMSTTLCSNELKSLQENHTQSISSIRKLAEECLIRDYSVDRRSGLTPKPRNVALPSVESIEELRTPTPLESLSQECDSENISAKQRRGDVGEAKVLQSTTTISRPPFVDVN